MKALPLSLFSIAVLMLVTGCSSSRRAAAGAGNVPALDAYAVRYNAFISAKQYDLALALTDSMLSAGRYGKENRIWLRCARAEVALTRGEYDDAEKQYSKLYRRNPDNLQVLFGAGAVWYNRAVTLSAEADLITEKEIYLEAMEQSRTYMRKALPYFEKGRSVAVTSRAESQYRSSILSALRSAYYMLGMGPEFDRADRELMEEEQR